MTAPALADVDPGHVYWDTVAEAQPAGKGKRYGKAEPRVCTPPLRALTPDTSWGYSVIEFARDILGVDLMPWQRSLLIRMLETLPDGSLRFATVVVLVARQNGKSTVSQVLALWFMMVRGWPLVLGTAQDLETAEEVWEGAVDLLLDDAGEDDEDSLADFVDKVIKVNGKKSLVLTNKTRYKVKAANRRAGRGFSGNLIMLDELREHQNWAAWGAITKTTQAQLFSLVLALSNAGDATSVVLRYLRMMAHKAIGDPDGICADEDEATTAPTPFDFEVDGEDQHEDDFEAWEQEMDTLGLFEWSAPPECDKWDRNGWAHANPALGHRIQERKIASDCATDPEHVFRVEVLCQWLDGTMDGPFPPGAWEKGRNVPKELADGSKVIRAEDRIVGPVVACIDRSFDRGQTYVGFAGHRADGTAQFELVVARYGTDWVQDWLMEDKRRHRITAVTGQAKGAPISPLLKDLAADPKFTIPVEEWSGGDLMAACGQLFDLVKDQQVRHNPQPPLDIAADTAAVKNLGDGFVFDRKNSPADVAPLMNMAGALWLLLKRRQPPPPPPPPPAALETSHSRTHGHSEDDFDGDTLTSDLNGIGF